MEEFRFKEEPTIIRKAAEPVADEVAEVVKEVAETAEEVAETAVDAAVVEEAAEKVKDKVEDVAETIETTAEEIAAKGFDAGSPAQDFMDTLAIKHAQYVYFVKADSASKNGLPGNISTI